MSLSTRKVFRDCGASPVPPVGSKQWREIQNPRTSPGSPELSIWEHWAFETSFYLRKLRRLAPNGVPPIFSRKTILPFDNVRFPPILAISELPLEAVTGANPVTSELNGFAH